VVLVSDSARFKLPFAGLGLVPEAASSLLLPAAIGPQAANYFLLTGDWMDAETAVSRGLAWKRCAPEQLLEEALGLARSMAKAPLESLRSTKQLLQAARADAVQATLDRELGYLAEITRRYRGF
jgi:enoyl-CoA hydratase/carnithine racemase